MGVWKCSLEGLEQLMIDLEFFKSKKGRLLTLLITFLGLSSAFLPESSFVGMFIFRNCMCLAGVIILFYALHYFTFNNVFLKFLSKYSAEIYIFQFVLLSITSELDSTVRLIIVVSITILSALFLKPFITLCKKSIVK